MGVCISHLKLTNFPTENSETFLLEDWDDCHNIPSEILEKYITEVEVFEPNLNTNGINTHEIPFRKMILKKVFYCEEVGEQNKGVKNGFRNEVAYEFLHYDKETFELAYALVIDEDIWKQSFKRDFLDNYEEGRSLLLALG
jgi:hypothetical protein